MLYVVNIHSINIYFMNMKYNITLVIHTHVKIIPYDFKLIKNIMQTNF